MPTIESTTTPVEAEFDREIDERAMSGPRKAARLTTYVAPGYLK
jgi:hypothetical protein